MAVPSVQYITTANHTPAPAYRLGGMTLLERRVREARRAGAARILVACDGELPAELQAVVERTSEPPPPGAVVVRADELAGVEVTSGESARRAEWRHLQGMMKSFQGLTDAWVNHHVSLRITRLVAGTWVRPNHITILTIVVAIAGMLAILSGGHAGLVVGSLALQAHNILDSCDGELARLTFRSSKVGMWLDNVSDDICDAGFIAAVGWVTGGPWWPLALAAVLARVYLQGDLYRHVIRLGGEFNRFRWFYEQDKADIDEVYARSSWKTYVRALFRRDTYALLWAILGLLGQVEAIIVYALVIFASQAAVMVVHSVLVARGRAR